jgi:hypothetical protein
MQGWLINAKVPFNERRYVSLLYVAAVESDAAAIEAVRRRIAGRSDERFEAVRLATENELRGLRQGAVKNLN